MNGEIIVIEAVEWREPAPGGGSQAQVFRLADNRFALVKFPENGQGELVLANEFLCCRLAEHFDLPINRVVHVSIDERLVHGPRQSGQIPIAFSAGIRCGMIRFENSQGIQPADVSNLCSNSAELHDVAVFEQLVNRGDGRQLLMYTPAGENVPRFAAYDYGFAFAANANWTTATLPSATPPVLPATDPLNGQAYAQDGAALARFVNKLRILTGDELTRILAELHPPRWGISENDMPALVNFLDNRARSLVQQFDQRHQPPQTQLEGI